MISRRIRNEGSRLRTAIETVLIKEEKDLKYGLENTLNILHAIAWVPSHENSVGSIAVETGISESGLLKILPDLEGFYIEKLCYNTKWGWHCKIKEDFMKKVWETMKELDKDGFLLTKLRKKDDKRSNKKDD